MARRDDDEYVEFATAAQARLRHTAYLICGDWDQASDLVQEALVKVYVAWPRIDRKGAVLAYARRAVVSVAIDRGRRRSSTERPVEDLDRERPTSLLADHADVVGDRTVLMDALRRLPSRQRACVVLRYFEDASVTEVAHALGCTEGTVKSQTFKALKQLRQLIGDLDVPDPDAATAGGSNR